MHMTVFTSAGIRALLAFCLLFGAAILYGWTFFYRDPGSVFYDPAHAFIRMYSEYREAQAHTFIEDIGRNLSRIYTKAGPSPKLCATVLTVNRVGAHYLPDSIGSLLEGMTDVERSDLYLSVFFANADPTLHPSWGKGWLERLVDEATTYNQLHEDIESIRQLEVMPEAAEERIVINYAHALRHCLDTNATWIGILEDDVIAADGWFVRTLRAFGDITSKVSASSRPWLYMRIFDQERSTGWATRKIGGNNEHWISLAIGIPLLIGLLVMRRWSSLLRHCLDKWALAVICLLAIPAFVVLFFQAGKTSLLPPSPGVIQERFGCCAQGLFFPRTQVEGLIEYLRENRNRPVDLLINDRSSELDLDCYALYPSQLQHIGGHSARGSGEAQLVWSVGYENHDPLKLREEHAENVRFIYGRKNSTAI